MRKGKGGSKSWGSEEVPVVIVGFALGCCCSAVADIVQRFETFGVRGAVVFEIVPPISIWERVGMKLSTEENFE